MGDDRVMVGVSAAVAPVGSQLMDKGRLRAMCSAGRDRDTDNNGTHIITSPSSTKALLGRRSWPAIPYKNPLPTSRHSPGTAESPIH